MRLLAFLIVAAVLAFGGWILAGGLDIAADSPHSWPVFEAIAFARERSIDAHARHVTVPQLGSLEQLQLGGAHYKEMCDGCHLGPGVPDNDFRKGLYPQPPDFSKEPIDDPAEAFWVIKHGLKMTGMPAWGLSHDDKTLWAIVAFVQQLPSMTPEQYQKIGAAPDAGHDHAAH